MSDAQLLRPDPAQQARLIDIRDNLIAASPKRSAKAGAVANLIARRSTTVKSGDADHR
ncbi:hypothetical protein ABWJ92_28800 [Streptomyces sp. NPDC000609]|uniref:hypothetical protein n=1 Tax=Streptomyces sp. NPDC000609 TaxID=3160957 RepID=UPI003397ACB8